MSLHQVWEAASASPYSPLIAKDSQFFVGFSLLLAAFLLTGLFGLNRSFTSIALFGVPASLAFGFGAVYMICAVGVYLSPQIPMYHILERTSNPKAMTDSEPIFTAVSSNAHHLYTLLQCIGFAPKATVQLTPDGIRFSVEEARTVQGLAFLDKALFTSYIFNAPRPPATATDDHDEDHESPPTNTDTDTTTPTTYYPCFEISLSALLETLKILGINDSSASGGGSSSSRAGSVQPGPSAFTTPALLLDRSCTLRYDTEGSPLSITLTETGVKTTCELTTYEPEGGEIEIPLQRDAICMKIIMRSAWLHDAITELAATDPVALKVSASATREPFFALSGAGGSFSESTVEFSVENQTTGGGGGDGGASNNGAEGENEGASRAKRARLAPTVTETFLVSPPSSMGSRIRQDYKFASIQKAARAMAVANKVSIRGDRQGVLSLQFMIEFDVNGGSAAKLSARGGLAPVVSFVDFRFVPLLDGEGDGELL
ncbi:putative DNA repair protein Rad1 [Aspergillus homomorphus CBS 101889]|uniref:Rad1-domain-containing protein n=1 Tax=Aspergillus homomorphus (strain CBS 101889) TaxID=1450537 RepID=A0A395IAE8_ASPHC|nr:Rad1-domain-containing protein [Aspergillus homomorphus CBS 101889]RAL17182.1 Rad1-domain-containing protein [Aspergillus homomorphus CBS 101889]